MPDLNITKPELIWPGKYDENGKRIVNRGAALPFQIIETIRDGRATRESGGPDLFAFASQKNEPDAADTWRNKLIWGDNLLVMSSLLQQFAGKIDLIYIDPPFAVGADFTFITELGEGGFQVAKEQSIIEEKAYRDTWGLGISSYLTMLYDRLIMMRELLSEKGHLLVHLGPEVSAYARCLLEEVFGTDNFRNEIILPRPISKNLQRQFEEISSLPQSNDVLLWFSKNVQTRVPNLFEAFDAKTPEGYWHRFWSGANRPTMRYELLGEKPTHGQWKWSEERAKHAVQNYLGYEKLANGRSLVQYWRDTGKELEFIRKSKTGTVESWFPPSDDRLVGTIWDGVKVYENRKDYPTQKHEDMLFRIIEWLSVPKGIVADFFCGSGTTLAVAEKLGRRWIGADLGRFAIHTTRKRLLGIPDCKPFQILNLGQYERKYWQGVTFGKPSAEPEAALIAEYVRFILELYQAQPCPGFRNIHGRKGGALVVVGAVDAPVTITQVNEAVAECAAAGQKELHILGWEWEMGMNDPIIKQAKVSHGVTLRLLTIPREVMEKRAVECGDIRFFDVAYLKAAVLPQDKAKRKVKVELKDFAMPDTELIPEEVRQKITKWSDYIDYWAVDWDYRRDTFMNQWQTYRTRTDRRLALVSEEHEYTASGAYEILVKVVDIFGNDTSLLLEWKTK